MRLVFKRSFREEGDGEKSAKGFLPPTLTASKLNSKFKTGK